MFVWLILLIFIDSDIQVEKVAFVYMEDCQAAKHAIEKENTNRRHTRAYCAQGGYK